MSKNINIFKQKNARTPHIKVDALSLADPNFSGVGHYTLGIVRGFDEMAKEGKLTYSLIVPRRSKDRLKKFKLKHYKRIIVNPIPHRIIRGFIKYKWPVPIDLILGIGNYYFPNFEKWPTWFSKTAVVIHDITYAAVPECVEKPNLEYLKVIAPASIKRATKVISVSEFSKSEIVKFHKTDPNKISVANPSIDKKHFYRRSEEENKSVRLKYDIFDDKYMFAVGNLEPRKNYSRLIDAYTSLPKKITKEYPLLIVGAYGWNNKELKDKIQQAKEDGFKIIHPGQFVLDEDMPALYSGAELFMFVPIYEGFGMPPLEAYACGTRVIASNNSSVPESAGDACIYADPFSVSDIRDKIQEALSMDDKEIKSFEKKMKTRISKLNWRGSSEITASTLTGMPIDYFRK